MNDKRPKCRRCGGSGKLCGLPVSSSKACNACDGDGKDPTAGAPLHELEAATLDASWRRNGHGGGRRYHIVSYKSWSACGLWPLNNDEVIGPIPAIEVPNILRCLRNGCRERWLAEDELNTNNGG